MKGRLAWLLAGIVVTVTVLGSGSFSLWYLTAFRPDVNYQTQTASYSGQPAGLTIQLDSGDITLTAGPAGRVEVTRTLGWSDAKPVIDQQWNGQALSIREQCPTGVFAKICTANFTIAVPPGVTVNATTDQGTIRAAGLAGALNLTSLDGDVVTTGTQSSQVLASTDSGDIRLRFASLPDFVKAETDAGDVVVAVPPGTSYNVQATADAGSRNVAVATNLSTRRYIYVTSDSGDVSVVYN